MIRYPFFAISWRKEMMFSEIMRHPVKWQLGQYFRMGKGNNVINDEFAYL